MNFKSFLEKLQTLSDFKQFIKENPDAYLCSGFFILDKIGKEGDKQYFDYYLPKKQKMISFQLEDKLKIAPLEIIENKSFEKISDNIDFNLEDVEKIIIEEMKKQEVKNKVQKILLSLQSFNGKNFLIGTIFISTLGMIKFKLSLPENKIIEFEKKSFLDMFKIIKKKSKSSEQQN